MTIQICIGSACHLKGSYPVIDSLQNWLKEDGLEQRVEIKASFCLGQCTSGVSIIVNDEPVSSVSPETVRAFYETKVLGSVGL